MTILLLVLAFLACLQACRLLLTLSINALPVGTAIATAFWLNDFGHGLLFSILLALLVGMALAGTAPWLCARCNAPAVRRLLMPQGAAAVIASLFAGTLIGISAARRLG